MGNQDIKHKLFEIMKKVNPDFNYDIEEGVGDEYLKNKYHIPDEFDDFEKKYSASKRNVDDVFYNEGDWQLLKNPKNINDLGNSVRGVILENGDLYVESYSKVIHNDILKILSQKGVLNSIHKKNWTAKLPTETGFLTVQRYKNSPYIAIGESNRLLYDESSYEKSKEIYDEFIDNARHKMPQIKFINKLVGTKNVLTNKRGSNLMNETYL